MQVLDGLFALVKRLYDVNISPADGEAPVWCVRKLFLSFRRVPLCIWFSTQRNTTCHFLSVFRCPDVRFFVIKDNANVPIAYFYLDPYSRPAEKRGGAWMDEVVGRSKLFARGGKVARLPVAHMVCNGTPPVGGKPSLMTFREVETRASTPGVDHTRRSICIPRASPGKPEAFSSLLQCSTRLATLCSTCLPALTRALSLASAGSSGTPSSFPARRASGPAERVSPVDAFRVAWKSSRSCALSPLLSSPDHLACFFTHQFMENWCYHKPTLLGLARHVDTGAPLPDELYEKLKAAKTFRAASMMLRQLHFAQVDLELHSRYIPNTGKETANDVNARVALKTTVMPPLAEDRFLCSFSHIFAGGYSAGYYSYKWAEVLSADAFAAFEEAGLDDDKTVAEVRTSPCEPSARLHPSTERGVRQLSTLEPQTQRCRMLSLSAGGQALQGHGPRARRGPCSSGGFQGASPLPTPPPRQQPAQPLLPILLLPLPTGVLTVCVPSSPCAQDFRGREPSTVALLRHSGLAVSAR